MGQLCRTRQRIASRLRSERGYTLNEMLVAMVVAAVVLTATVSFLVVTFRQQNDISSRSVASDQAEAGLQQLTRDLREAMTNVSVSSGATTTSISFQIPTQNSVAAGQAVTWTCPNASSTGVGNCTRTLAGTSKIEIIGVQSMVFTPYNSNNPPTALSLPVTNSTGVSAVTATLTVRVESYGLISHGTVTSASAGTSANPIVLQATADLRNFA